SSDWSLRRSSAGQVVMNASSARFADASSSVAGGATGVMPAARALGGGGGGRGTIGGGWTTTGGGVGVGVGGTWAGRDTQADSNTRDASAIALGAKLTLPRRFRSAASSGHAKRRRGGRSTGRGSGPR